jgi:GNAT superfamily N-acetyltransferase
VQPFPDALRPERRLVADSLEASPVRPRRSEHVEHDRTLRAGAHHCVRHVRRNGVGPASRQIPHLVADPKRERPAEDDAELLVLVAVLGDDARRLELDDGEVQALAFDGPRDDPLPDLERLQSGEVFERTHEPEAIDVEKLPFHMTEIRDLREDETAFLREMLYAALVWRPGVELPPPEWVLAHPQVVVFHEGWGRDGDVGLVAEEDGTPLGLAWYRFFTDAEHGEGFVDEATPEVAVAVVDGHRGLGIGRALMEAIHARAREQGVTRISLSVDADNPARRLYLRLGYVDVEPGDEDGRMILELT